METPSKEELREQVRGHLESLRRAGVDWLPTGPALNWIERPSGVEANAVGTKKAIKAEGTLFVPEPPAMSEAGLTLDQRRTALKVLAKEVSGCARCAELASTRTQTVFAHGEPGVELCFVGEAPGADEDAQGFPFVGAAGQLLNRIIEAMGMKRDDVYICNIIKCRPPGNRTPLPSEADNCRPFLEKQLELVQPKYLVALGGCAATNLLQTTLPLGKLRGRFHDYKGIPVVVTYHPAYLLPHRAPDKKRDVWEDMKMLLTKMGRPIPQKKEEK